MTSFPGRHSDSHSRVVLKTLRRALLAWYDTHRRDLPWRRTRDPYAIWVSEIMLQQTRVAAVLDHYARWMERFPTFAALAAAEEPEVLAYWSGLGYYRRARFLHQGARAVAADYAGVIPRTAAALRSLPGIGEYTSAAIASIAFDEPIAVVDGNVERVLIRLDGLAPVSSGTVEQRDLARQGNLSRAIRERAQALLDPTRPGDWNQAVMELGATVCLPRAPLCLHCPWQSRCVTRGEHTAAPRPAMLARRISYALVERTGVSEYAVLLRQRPAASSLMAGMWELPELAADATGTPVLTLKHSITVTNYTVSILSVDAGDGGEVCPGGEWFAVEQLPELALTGLTRKVLRRLGRWPTHL